MLVNPSQIEKGIENYHYVLKSDLYNSKTNADTVRATVTINGSALSDTLSKSSF